MAILAIAAIPPPPVNQNFGIYDTMMINYTEPLCRGCHNSTSSPLVTGGVPTRHHNLVATSAINPSTSQPFGCQDCHPSTPGSGFGILIDRNCMDCHNSTPFWGDSLGAHVSNFTRPHHNTTHAQARNCKFCHGASVDDYNDGHYIPPYPPSEVTPSALYKAFNSTSGRVWGGCLACHSENALANPPIYFTQVVCGIGGQPCPIGGVYSAPPNATGNNNAHHNEILGITGGPTQIFDKCTWCHVDISDVLNVRGCETCHSVRSIHNVQYDFANTSTLRGYGHIGSNNPSDPANHSWDCKGCHAWYDAGDVNPFAGAIVPDVQLANPTVFNANTPTVVTLTGTNFVQTGATTVVNIDDKTNLTPDVISNGQITVTVNLAAGAHYIKVVKTDAVENVPKPSDIKPLTVVSKVTINSATLNGGTLTISGTGLGSQPATNAQQYVTFNHAGNVYYSDSITSWSDTQIVATLSGSVAAGDTVTVITADSGQATATIVGGTPTPTPSITVTSPNGGENWKRGTTHAITWTSVGNPGGSVKIELLKGTSVVSTIAKSASNTGPYNWNIPRVQSTGTNYKIRITSTSNSLYTDMSDNNFQISR
ncbi:MAG: hypothetical protein O8C65_08050 [Candidatus Methanoperedens sp.]|nr:hypothetical protein [Candidatus Methanoperedens sp.]